MSRDRLINSLLMILCGVLGGSSSYILGNILLSGYSSNRFLVSLIMLQLIVILLFIVTLRYLLKKTHGESLVSLCIVVFVISLIFTPAVVNKLDHYLSIPSGKEQHQTIKEVSNIISQTNIPYKVDEKESKERTKKYGLRVDVVLVKTMDGFFDKSEIAAFLAKLPKGEISLTFYTLGKSDVFGLAVDNDKSIFTCAPFETCKELDIEY